MQFFSFTYWFDFPAYISTPMLVVLLVVFGVMFVGGLAALALHAKIEDRLVRQVARRAGRAAAWIGVVGLILTFARAERTPIFMYRYWLLFLGVWAVIWGVRIQQYADNRAEQLEEETRRFRARDRFLTKKK